MKPSDSLVPLQHKVEPSAIAELAGILRDPNPIHLNPEAAATAGLGSRVINQGPANLAYIINMLGASLPGYRLVAISSRYLGNVRGGDVVTAGGLITGQSGREIECEVWLRLEDGSAVVTATARLERRP